jgi:hypothetical protein
LNSLTPNIGFSLATKTKIIYKHSNPHRQTINWKKQSVLIKNIMGAMIILLNMAGLGYLFFLGISEFFADRDADDQEGFNNVEKLGNTTGQPIVIDEDIIPDEDDLLKDMDLSDLDSIDLNDFD